MSVTKDNPSTCEAIQRAANRGTTTRPEDGCKDCNKKGLAILPVIPTVAPNELRGRTPELKWLDDRYVAEGLTQHWYVLRALTAGYLYVLKPDKTWDGYVVDAAGLARMMPVAQLPGSPAEQKPMSEVCKRHGDNIPAQVIAIDPDKYPTVWMAFSRYRWTEQVLADYASNKEGRRDQRMIRLDVKAAAANRLGVGKAVPNGAAMGQSVGEYVADYASAGARAALNKHLFTPLYARTEQVESLVKAMARISAKTPGKTGAIIVLNDPVGITIELNARRTLLAGEAARAGGLGDEQKTKERVVADVIEGIRAHAETNPGPWYDRNYGPDRFLKHVDQGRWQAALKLSAEFKAAVKRTEAVSGDYVKAIVSDAWKAIQRYDFDGGDDWSALDHRAMCADCVIGSGVTDVEKEKVWYQVLETLDPGHPDNWLYRALASMVPDATKFFSEENEWDKVGDITTDTPKTLNSMLEDGAQTIVQLHAVIRARRAANQATRDLIETASSLLLHLHTKKPKAAAKFFRRAAIALLTQADVVPQPVLIRGTLQRIGQAIMSAVVGDARVQGLAPATVAAGGVPPNGRYVAMKGNLGGKGMALSQAADGAVLFTAPSGDGEIRTVTAWIVQRLQSGGKLRAEDLRKIGLARVDFTAPVGAPVVNPYLRNRIAATAAQADIGFSALMGLVQIAAMVVSFKNLASKPGATAKIDAGVEIVTGGMALLALHYEVQLAKTALATTDNAASTAAATAVRNQLIRRIAKLGAYANYIEGVWFIIKGGYKARTQGDFDSGLWTIGSGVMLLACGGATIKAGGALIAASGSLSVPVVGWTLAAIAALGLVLYMGINAYSTDDNNLIPLEYWLDNGAFGRRAHAGKTENPFFDTARKTTAPFTTLNDEMYGLSRVTLVAVGDVTSTSDRNSIGLLSNYQVAVPRYAKGSRLTVEFWAIKDKKVGERIGEVEYLDGGEKPAKLSFRAESLGMHEDPKAEIDKEQGNMRLKGYFAMQQGGLLFGLLDQKGRIYAENVEMRVSYWPDRVNMPELVSTLTDRG